MKPALPDWSQEVIARYTSGSAGCFVLHGNVNDRTLVLVKEPRLDKLTDFLSEVLLPRFTHKPLAALREVLTTSRPPIPIETLKAQMRLAADEATESSFVPPEVEAEMKTIF
ncbi:hypothetical protein N9051_00075 [Akkermansiaceae bacterium]|nr:hypothetical protein [Akkermansiaceae bacterium]